MFDPDGCYDVNGLLIPKRLYDSLASAQQKLGDALFSMEKVAGEIAEDMTFDEEGKKLIPTYRHIKNICDKLNIVVYRECDGGERWIAESNPTYSPFDPHTEPNVYYCSRCGKKQSKRSNFCPECGARMEV